MSLMRVDFPHPLGPIIPVTLPSSVHRSALLQSLFHQYARGFHQNEVSCISTPYPFRIIRYKKKGAPAKAVTIPRGSSAAPKTSGQSNLPESKNNPPPEALKV